MTDYSCLMFERLGCRDYARFDFRADAAGTPKLLEVNPNPGWCWDGKFNLMAAFDGLRYADLLRLILEAAQNRVVAAWQPAVAEPQRRVAGGRSEEHTSELQSLMRISYAVFCWKKK